MEQELALAATIQQNLFPAELPKLAGFDLARAIVPREVAAAIITTRSASTRRTEFAAI